MMILDGNVHMNIGEYNSLRAKFGQFKAYLDERGRFIVLKGITKFHVNKKTFEIKNKIGFAIKITNNYIMHATYNSLSDKHFSYSETMRSAMEAQYNFDYAEDNHFRYHPIVLNEKKMYVIIRRNNEIVYENSMILHNAAGKSSDCKMNYDKKNSDANFSIEFEGNTYVFHHTSNATTYECKNGDCVFVYCS